MLINIFLRISISLFIFCVAPSYAKSFERGKLPEGVKFIRKAPIVKGTSPIYEFHFKNGLKLLVLSDSRNPMGYVKFILDAGSNREVKGKTGLAHFFEHMMFRKTEKQEEGHYDKVLSSLGGSGNAGTSDNFVMFYSSFPGPALERILSLEKDRFLNLDLKDPYFSTEKGAVISERKLTLENDPVQRGKEVLKKITHKGTKTEWNIIGDKKDVEEMAISSAKKFYKDFYTPDNTILAIGGPFEINDVVSLVDKYFGKWQGQVTESQKALPKGYFTRDYGKRYICSENVSLGELTLNYPSSDKSYKSYVYSQAFATLLDRYAKGSYRHLLVTKNLASSFSAYKSFWHYKESPMTVRFTLMKNTKIDDVLTFWQNSLKEFLKSPMDSQAKKQLIKEVEVENAYESERMSSLIGSAVYSQYFFHKFDIDKKHIDIIKNMTQSSIRKWVNMNLNSKKFYVTAIVPPGDGTVSCNELKEKFLH